MQSCICLLYTSQKILTRTGRLEFKTDNRSLFEFSLESVEENGWRLIASTNDLHHSELKEGNIMTEYELSLIHILSQ